MKVTTHRTGAWVETSESESSEAETAPPRSPPLCGTSEAENNVGDKRHDRPGLHRSRRGNRNRRVRRLVEAAASPWGSTLAGELEASTGCVGEADILR
eukprot:5850953-Pleurochrysis_carterae.AAC.1